MNDTLDLGDLRQELEALPQDPVSLVHPRHWLFRTRRVMDTIGHARPEYADFFRKVNPYPRPFEHHKIETEDGVTIALWYGPARDEDAKFGIVCVPGIFSSKDDTVHKRRSIAMWRHWGIPVICMDTRGFGESTGICTGGWKEALDVHAAARFLQERSGVERVALFAESMGGASALNALAYDEESEARILTGGALCWSAFVDLFDAVHYISSEPPKTDPFHPTWAAFRKLLAFRSRGGYRRFDDYLEDAAQVNGLGSFKDMADLANPKWKTSLIKAPTLLVHAHDDPIIPLRHARRMERYAKDHPHIQVLTVPFGVHTQFEEYDAWWYWEVARRFYGHVNGVELPNISRRSGGKRG